MTEGRKRRKTVFRKQIKINDGAQGDWLTDWLVAVGNKPLVSMLQRRK